MARNMNNQVAVNDNTVGAPGVTMKKKMTRRAVAPFEDNRARQSSTGRFPVSGMKPENNEPIPASELLKRPLGAASENVGVLRRPLGTTGVGVTRAPTMGGSAPVQNKPALRGIGAGNRMSQPNALNVGNTVQGKKKTPRTTGQFKPGVTDK